MVQGWVFLKGGRGLTVAWKKFFKDTTFTFTTEIILLLRLCHILDDNFIFSSSTFL